MSENEALIREIASVLDHPSLYMGGPSRGSMLKAKAILPIIRRRELEAGEKVRDAVMPYLEDIAALTENPTYDPLEVGFRHSPLSPQEIRERYARACAMAWQDTQNAIRALDVAAIIGDSHD